MTDKTTDNKIYLKCEFVRTLKCKDRIHSNSINTIILHKNNNAQPSLEMLFQVKFNYLKKKFMIIVLLTI